MNGQQEPNPKRKRPKIDVLGRVLTENHHQTLTSRESFGAQVVKDCEIRDIPSGLRKQATIKVMEDATARYEAEHHRLQCMIGHARVTLHETKATLRALCKQHGVQVVPGKTCAADLLKVTGRAPSLIARDLKLKFGAGLRNPPVALKALVVIFEAFVNSVAWGAMISHVNFQHPFKDQGKAIIALTLGLATSVLLWWGLSGLWGIVGHDDGKPPAERETRSLHGLAVLATVGLFTFLICLDTVGISSLSPARAAWDPTQRISLPLAFGAACLCGLAYMLGTSPASYATGYNYAAQGLIDGIAKQEAAKELESRKADPFVQEAIELLGTIQELQEEIPADEARVKQLEEQYIAEMNGLVGNLPAPVQTTPDQAAQSRKHDALCLAKQEREQAHRISRSANGIPATTNQEGEEE